MREKKVPVRKTKVQPHLNKTPAVPTVLADDFVIPTPSETTDQPPGKFFPIVGIGASAGGLAAFEAFFSGLPKDTDPGMAFVAVQHLDPNHKSILTDLIRRYTRMQVVEVEDGMVVQPNTAYIIPPARDMVIKKCGSKYYASMFMQAHITSSVTEMDLASKSLFMEYFERAISSARSVVKFSVVAAGIDMTEFGNKLKSRRGEIETNRARLAASGKVSEQAELTRLDREVAMINKQLERLAAGEKPMEVIAYVMTTAVGLSREDASRKVRAQAAEVKTGVGNSLNVDILMLADEDMLRCLEWEYMLPTTLAELTEQVL